MLSLYKSLVRPHVEYCISAWNQHYKKDKELIEKVQRRFTKMINNMEGKSYDMIQQDCLLITSWSVVHKLQWIEDSFYCLLITHFNVSINEF